MKTLLEESTDAAIAMDSMQEYKLFAVGSSDDRSPIEVELELDGHRIRMEIDTGASLSLVSEATFKQLCVCLSLAEQSVTVSVSPYLVLPD